MFLEEPRAGISVKLQKGFLGREGNQSKRIHQIAA